MADNVNPKWSDLPAKTGYDQGTWNPLPGRFMTEVAERCEDFAFSVCTLCGAVVEGYHYQSATDLHTDYHRKQGF